MNLLRYVSENWDEISAQIVTHAVIAGTAIAFASGLGVVLGALASQVAQLRGPIIGLGSVALTLPSFALFSVLAVYVGVGDLPVEIGLVIYGLLPVMRNTVAGLRGVDPAIVDAAVGMGMTTAQRLRRIQLPLALPLIFAGIRQAAVMIVAIATVGAAVGANDLGQQILLGIHDARGVAIVAGIIPVVLMAVLIDRSLAFVEIALRRGRDLRVSDL